MVLLCGDGGILRCVNEFLDVFLLALGHLGGSSEEPTAPVYATSAPGFSLKTRKTRSRCLRQSSGGSDEQNRAAASYAGGVISGKGHRPE